MSLSSNPTLQEVYDHIVNGLREQKVPAFERVEKGLNCMYRTQDGKKCAAGQAIPDEHYAEWMEDKPIAMVVRCESFPEALYWMRELKMTNLIGQLQNIHDTVADNGYDGGTFGPYFERRIKEYASVNGLKYTPPIQGESSVTTQQ